MRLGDFTPDRELARRAEILAFRLLFGPNTFQVERPFGSAFRIIGVGIDGQHKLPVLFVEDKLLGAGSIADARNIPELARAIAAVTLEGEQWEDQWGLVIARGMSDPVEQISTGDVIRGSRRGTAGAPVQWKVGGGTQHGILTAGHVAGTATNMVDGSGAHAGKVAQCLLPAKGGIDVAVVELSSASPSTRLAGPHGLTGATNVELLGPGRRRTAGQVVAKAGWFYWASSSATYVDLYVTGSTISNQGDSGSAATLSGSTDVIGMLVGASTGSLIQDARTQINAITGLSHLTF